MALVQMRLQSQRRPRPSPLLPPRPACGRSSPPSTPPTRSCRSAATTSGRCSTIGPPCRRVWSTARRCATSVSFPSASARSGSPMMPNASRDRRSPSPPFTAGRVSLYCSGRSLSISCCPYSPAAVPAALEGAFVSRRPLLHRRPPTTLPPLSPSPATSRHSAQAPFRPA